MASNADYLLASNALMDAASRTTEWVRTRDFASLHDEIEEVASGLAADGLIEVDERRDGQFFRRRGAD